MDEALRPEKKDTMATLTLKASLQLIALSSSIIVSL
jgi:hypothetical protein